ncbi:MAG: DUF1553 domain-containing protein [Verrucomicrobiales bacterium]|nr:DUF1553 domain-containing protein [Verrucomicrobiales bacterium]
MNSRSHFPKRTKPVQKIYRLVLYVLFFTLTSYKVFAAESEPIVSLTFSDSKEAGPRSPLYPSMRSDNAAGLFTSAKDAIQIKTSYNQLIKIGAGQSITMEAWVKVKALKKGKIQYLIGRGRDGNEATQNYAMRLQDNGSGIQLGFLFCSESLADTAGREFHRWWSDATFNAEGWHHVAVVYTFGKGNSLRAYIDGKPTKGVWDLGGNTNLPPVVKEDSDLVIGSSSKLGPGHPFNGWLDDVRVYREALSDKILRSRFVFTPPPPQITKAMLKPGKVLVQISEKGVIKSWEWPDWPVVTEDYTAPAFGFFELPHKYISTGVRADRANPTHIRASALVTIPAGKHRLLLRGRGATRLKIDGKLILENPFPSKETGAHTPLSVQDDYLDLGADFRFAPPGNLEKWVDFDSKGGEHFVIIETILGGVLSGTSKRRPEFGETVVAISLEGSESWNLLSPNDRKTPYTDEGWAGYEAEQAGWLASENTRRRTEKRAEQDGYWSKRREAAAKWLAGTKPVAVPELPKGMPANNAIDHFIGAQIVKVATNSKPSKNGGIDYFKEVQPLLETKCYDCHKGSKIKGDLRLDTREAAFKGGEADGPSVVPGKVEDSSLIWRIRHDAGDDIMPPKGDPLTKAEIALLEKWVQEGASWPQFDVVSFEPTPLAGDLVFLRRVALDIVGVPPTEAEISKFLAEPKDKRRPAVIDRYLADERWADHWMGYWQDVLAENPNILNPTLNNTGPFRWWIYESLLDNKPLDLFVTELIRMEGSERFGGPRGFGTASQNDVPMAAKGIVISSAFLGVEMKCARCHDAPGHEWMQKDLFELAAMLEEKPVTLPLSSSVPLAARNIPGRKSLIKVTLKPGSSVDPRWPFDQFVDSEDALKLTQNPNSKRDQLAALITAPQNERFAQVMANRIWQRYMGRGIVDVIHDWEKGSNSHPELLKWLGRELVAAKYDTKAISRLILNSNAYQRTTDPNLQDPSPLYVSPSPRRLQAEQVIDSLFSATGKPFNVEEVSLDIDSMRDLNNAITLGKPRRAWMLASTSNERDRPSLSLPRITAVTSIMETFGWRGARQDPVSIRDTDENVLQPAILANGTMGVWLTRLSEDHGITRMALENQPVEQLVDRLFLRLLTRRPSEDEKDRYVEFLADDYDHRVIPESDRKVEKVGKRKRSQYISWSNHVDAPANALAVIREGEARAGAPPTKALSEEWRLRLEDVLWAMLNAPEWIYTP